MNKMFRFVKYDCSIYGNPPQYGYYYYDQFKNLPDPFTYEDFVKANGKKSVADRLKANVKLGTRIVHTYKLSNNCNLEIECVDGDIYLNTKAKLDALQEKLDNVNGVIKEICGDLLIEQKDLQKQIKQLKEDIRNNK